ncbi:MAG: hypothetical protein ACE5J2_03560 [Nitrososphaerales archaeon]
MNETLSRLVGYVLLGGAGLAIPTIAAPIIGVWSLDANVFIRALLVVAGTLLGLQLISQGSTALDRIQILNPFTIRRNFNKNQEPPIQEEIR